MGGSLASEGLDESVDTLVAALERILAEHGALRLVVELEVHPVDGEVAPALRVLDADEEVSPELREEIQTLLRRDAEGSLREDGFELLRVVFYLGRWWRLGGWHPEWRLRLARRDKVTWHGEEPHEHARVSGAVSRLRGELRHYTYRDIADQVARMNSHTSAAARSLHAKGRRAGLADLLLKPKARFFKFYILRKGWREGLPGFLVACMEAVSVYLKYFKLWELNRRR